MIWVIRKGRLLALTAACVLVVVLCITVGVALCLRGVTAFNRTQGVGWGLSYPAEGQPPAPPVSAELLREQGGYYLGDTREKVAFLTFDAGYENGYTQTLLDVLKQNDVPAAFFLVGHYLQTQPELVQRMVAEGHVVANHTLHHYGMDKLQDAETFAAELNGVDQLYQQLIGAPIPRFYRPPEGLYLPQNLQQAQQLGYVTVFWSLAYADWDTQNQPQPQQALQLLISRMHPGAVILLHATSSTNAAILDEFIKTMQAQGYRFESLYNLAVPGRQTAG